MSGPLRRNLLAVRVTPKASRNEVTGLYRAADGAVSLSVKVTAAPDKGQANAAVIKVLAKAILKDVEAGEPSRGLDPSTAELMKRLMV